MDDTMTMDEEVFLLKSGVIALEAENQELRNQVCQLKHAKDQLEQFILSMEQNVTANEQKKATKQPRKVSEYQKAFQVFYKNNKSNSDMLERLKTRLMLLGMNDDAEKLPWYIVRSECKRMFDEQQNDTTA